MHSFGIFYVSAQEHQILEIPTFGRDNDVTHVKNISSGLTLDST